MSKDIEELKKLAASLPPVPKLGDFKIDGPNCTQYEIENGTCFSWNLFSSKDTSVARTFISSGGKMLEHQHDEKEYAVIVSGRVVAHYKNKQKILNVRDCIVFEKGTPHSVRALEDTVLIAVTVPHSKDFPDAR